MTSIENSCLSLTSPQLPTFRTSFALNQQRQLKTSQLQESKRHPHKGAQRRTICFSNYAGQQIVCEKQEARFLQQLPSFSAVSIKTSNTNVMVSAIDDDIFHFSMQQLLVWSSSTQSGNLHAVRDDSWNLFVLLVYWASSFSLWEICSRASCLFRFQQRLEAESLRSFVQTLTNGESMRNIEIRCEPKPYSKAWSSKHIRIQKCGEWKSSVVFSNDNFSVPDLKFRWFKLAADFPRKSVMNHAGHSGIKNWILFHFSRSQNTLNLCWLCRKNHKLQIWHGVKCNKHL